MPNTFALNECLRNYPQRFGQPYHHSTDLARARPQQQQHKQPAITTLLIKRHWMCRAGFRLMYSNQRNGNGGICARASLLIRLSRSRLLATATVAALVECITHVIFAYENRLVRSHRRDGANGRVIYSTDGRPTQAPKRVRQDVHGHVICPFNPIPHLRSCAEHRRLTCARALASIFHTFAGPHTHKHTSILPRSLSLSHGCPRIHT